MNKFKSILMSVVLALTACGGSSSVTPVLAAQCSIPVEIKFEKLPGQEVRRLERATATSELVVAATGTGALVADYSCPGSGTQFLGYDFKSFNYFTFASSWGLTSAGDHFVTMLRADITQPVTMYKGRGPILMKSWGVVGEFFSYNAPGPGTQSMCQYGTGNYSSVPCGTATGTSWYPHPMKLVDLAGDDFYSVGIHAGYGNISYSVTNSKTGEQAAQAWTESNTPATLTGNKIVFATLCESDNCTDKVFVVHLVNIAAGWF